ncbi:hypothetical protein EON65_31465 [archaeon]|nr:MAG: hypothetical protein EON65_31465 [archaeon]
MTYNERAGKSGRGVVIQDINASTAICMGKIRDLSMYHKMVPHVKKVEIYESVKCNNVCSTTNPFTNYPLLIALHTYYIF